MTIYDLQLLFEDKAGILMSDVNKVFKTSEIERFLNVAQDIFIDELSQTIEINEKSRRDLTNLIESESISPFTDTSYIKLNDNSFLFDLSYTTKGTVKRIIEEQAIISGNRIPIKPITHDKYLANINNPYKKPYSNLVWRIDAEGIVELIPSDTAIISTYEIRYLREPTKLSFNSASNLDLNDNILNQIVELAVNLAINSISTISTKE